MLFGRIGTLLRPDWKIWSVNESNGKTIFRGKTFEK